MISICTHMYPWHRKFKRSQELINVLIASMNKCNHKEELELSIVDAGTEDIWYKGKNARSHDSGEYLEKIKSKWKGKLQYTLDPMGLLSCKNGSDKLWLAYLSEKSVIQSSGKYIFTSGMDIYLPRDFVNIYLDNVYKGRCAVFLPYHVRKGFPRKRTPTEGSFRSAKGLIGITRDDYIKNGGTNIKDYIRFRYDSERYTRFKKSLNMVVIKNQSLLHVDHPGCDEGTSEYKGTWK